MAHAEANESKAKIILFAIGSTFTKEINKNNSRIFQFIISNKSVQ